jgi:hypothetical protein
VKEPGDSDAKMGKDLAVDRPSPEGRKRRECVRKVLLCLVVIVAMGLVLTPMLSSAGPPPGSPPCDKAGPQQNNKNCADDGGNRCQNGKQPKKGCPTDGGEEPMGTCTNADIAVFGSLQAGTPNLICVYLPGNEADPSAPGECPDGVILGDTGGAITLLCSTA